MGFQQNPYDECVYNKRINGKICTIVWHVDDLKISHIEDKTVTKVFDSLQKKYGCLRVTRGNQQKFQK